MASRRFPDSGSRYATRRNGDQASNGVIVYFRDEAGTLRAPVYAERGTDNPAPADAFVNSQTHLDAFGGQVDFRGPNDDTDELFASVDGGPIFRVPAAPEPRLRALETALADAATTADLDALAGTVGGLSTSLGGKADDTAVVHKSGAETIAGAKTFSSPVTVATPTTGGHATTKAYVDATVAPAATAGQRLNIAAFAPLKRALDAGTTSVAVQVLGDSTGNDGDEWVALLAQQIATAYPAWSVHRRTFSDATQEYGAPTVVSTGTAGARYMDGTTGTITRQLTAAGSVNLTGVIDFRIKVTLTDWTPAAQVNLGGRSGGTGGTRGWYLAINTASVPVFVYSVDGTALTSVFGTASTGVADGTTSWVRVVFTPDDGAGNKTTAFYKSTDGVTWTQIGTTVSTAGTVVVNNPATIGYEIGGAGGGVSAAAPRVHEVWISAGGSSPSVVPALPDLWPRFSVNSAQVVGAPVLTFVNGSVPGQNIAYLGDSTRLPKLTPNFGQVLTVLSTSHNETNRVGQEWIASYETWRAAVRARLPLAPTVAIAQNPETTAATWHLEHAQRRADLLAYATAAQLPMVDVGKAFLDYGNWQADLMLDNIHPNPAGSALWMNTVKALFDAATV